MPLMIVGYRYQAGLHQDWQVMKLVEGGIPQSDAEQKQMYCWEVRTRELGLQLIMMPYMAFILHQNQISRNKILARDESGIFHSKCSGSLNGPDLCTEVPIHQK